MFITATSIKRLIRELNPPLITLRDPKEPGDHFAFDQEQEALASRYIEGSCFDLSLNRIEVKANRDDYAVISDQRRTPETEPLHLAKNGNWFLMQRTSYQLISNEFVNTPDWLMPIIHPKMTVLQSQCGFGCSFVKPGYKGTIMVEVHVIEGFLEIKRNEPFCSVAFGMFMHDDFLKAWQERGIEQIVKETDPYRGKRGGDKHGTQGEKWEQQ